MIDADAALAAADAAALAALGPCSICGSPDWIAVAPGSGGYGQIRIWEPVPDAPMPEVPSRVYCAICWRAHFLSADATTRDVRRAGI